MYKKLSSNFHAALVATAATGCAFGQYGALDGTFTPILASPGALGQACYGIVQQADRSLLVFGAYRSVNDFSTNSPIEIQHISKFSPGGVLDRNYFPQPNNYVNGVVAEPDGSVVAAGGFSSVNVGRPTLLPRPLMAKFDSTGTVDSTFYYTNSLGLSSINNVAAHATNGYVISADAGLFRFGLDGSIDSFFKYYYAGGQSIVWAARAQLDDKILINGAFTGTPPALPGSGVNNVYLERLSINGGAETPAFTPNPLIVAYTYATAVQPDKKILVGGTFGINNQYPLVGLTRLQENGSIDNAFAQLHAFEGGRTFIDGAVRCIALQADGKILIGGDFVNIRTGIKINNQWQYVERRGIARLNADGSLDTTFNANITGANFSVNCITIQDTGHILIGGIFQIVNGTNRPLVARLTNYEATQSLTYSGGQITWNRGGSAPDAMSVILEHRSAIAGSPWQLVDNGIAVRVGTSGNWTRTVNNAIPPYSYIRASARVSGGTYSGSSGIVSQTIGYQIPRVSLRRDSPFAIIGNGGSTDFQTVGVNRPKDLSFTLTNTGDGAMSSISAQLTGGQANQFSFVSSPSSTLAVGASTTFVVRFNPTSTGAKTTTLRINSNSPDTPQFNITLNGTAVSELEGFRYDYFGTTANTGNAADSADPDGDGQTNLFEFIAGLVPNDRNSKFAQRVDRSSGTPKVIFSPIVAGRTYEVETSTTLGNDWVAATGSTSNNGTERTFTHTGASDPKRFYRIKITK